MASIPTTSNDKIKGTSNNDRIDGLAGNDTISGSIGNDTLIGNSGNDQLYGEDGNDSLDGGQGADTIYGAAGNDVLRGGTENDWLDGGNGHDILDGGLGMDIMTGGAGNDQYTVDNVGDGIREGATPLDGIDKIFYTSQTSSTPFDMSKRAVNVEQLQFMANVDGTWVIGNALPNVIQGSMTSNRIEGLGGTDSLVGLGGDDTLDGGSGVDTLIGGDGSDTYKVSNIEDIIIETSTDGDADTIQTMVDYTLVVNVEVLDLLPGGQAVFGEGNALNNIVNGNEKDNTLNGLGGNDSLSGGEGNDTLDGSTGNDTLEGGDGIDIAVYSGASDDYQIRMDLESGTLYVMDIRKETVALDASGNPVFSANGSIAVVPISPDVLEGEDSLSGIELLRFSDDAEYAWSPKTDATPSDGMIDMNLTVWDGNMDTLPTINPLEDITLVGYIS